MQRHILTTLSLLWLLVAAPLLYGEIYQWKDEYGRIHFGDAPPETSQAKSVEVSPTNTMDSPSKSLVEETLARPTGVEPRKAAVLLYSATWCGVCKKARDWLRSKNIPFREYDIEKTERGQRDYAAMNGSGVPIIKVGKQRMSGFNSTTLTDMLKKAGYTL